VLGGAARALHEVVKAPMALCCQSVLAAASLAAQAHFDVQLPWGQRKPLSLFLLTVGESGERKSAVDDVVLGAAKAHEKTAMAAYLPPRARKARPPPSRYAMRLQPSETSLLHPLRHCGL